MRVTNYDEVHLPIPSYILFFNSIVQWFRDFGLEDLDDELYSALTQSLSPPPSFLTEFRLSV